MKYIDTHCHLDFQDYKTEIYNVLARMKEEGVGAITIGTDIESSKRAVEIADKNPNIWACIGVHPEKPQGENLKKLQGLSSGFQKEEFEKLVSHPKVVAIGECGLDWFRIPSGNMEAERERQTNLFKKQIEFALRYDKPLMLHCRDSYDDVLDILKEYKKEAGYKLRGNVHFFVGNVKQAEKFLDLGFTMSFTGVITFTSDYDEVIKFLPIEMILSETDSPFVTPVPYRGKKNEPIFVKEVVRKIAQIRGENEEKVRQIMLNNASRVFGV